MTTNARWWISTGLLTLLSVSATANVAMNAYESVKAERTESSRRWYAPTIANDDQMLRNLSCKLALPVPAYAKTTPATQP